MKYTELDGRLDCINGIPCKQGMGDDYLMGYGMQYQLEQLESGQLESGRLTPPNIDQNSEKREIKQ